jgi:SAM-dependent methyltransferase
MINSKENYSQMAKYYDAIYLKIVNYEREIRRLEKIFARHHSGAVKSILDIACGTGNYTFKFATRGYQTVGIDISDEMIEVAKGKAEDKTNPKFFKMDMRDIKLREMFDAATVLFGGFGYLHQEGDALKFLTSVRKRLKSGGLLAFEFWHDSAIRPASASSSGSSSWDRVKDGENVIVRLDLGHYSTETNILDVDFTCYVLNLAKMKVVQHFEEKHSLKTYSIPEMKDLLQEGNFRVLGFYNCDLNQRKDLEPPEQSTFRIMAVATHS